MRGHCLRLPPALFCDHHPTERSPSYSGTTPGFKNALNVFDTDLRTYPNRSASNNQKLKETADISVLAEMAATAKSVSPFISLAIT